MGRLRGGHEDPRKAQAAVTNSRQPLRPVTPNSGRGHCQTQIMKTLTYKAYTIVEHTSDLKNLPFGSCFLGKTKKKSIDDRRSYFGHPCDNPLKRGVICEVEVTVRVPEMPPVTEDLIDYVKTYLGRPCFLVEGDTKWNSSHIADKKATQARDLKKLNKLRPRK